MDEIKWQLNFGSCNFALKSYWLCARSILKSRVCQSKLLATQFNGHYKLIWIITKFVGKISQSVLFAKISRIVVCRFVDT